ncbi:MAG TPA: hypothetical protein VFX35_05020 [Solirubrobacterales bacterium]|nr:hypothetical protein [Solirubrobacterales bacterium]
MQVKGISIAVLCLTASLTVAISAGCGSSGSTASETSQRSETAIAEKDSSAPSKALFLAQAEEICEDGTIKKDEAVASELKKLDAEKLSSPDQVKILELTVLPIYAEIIEQIDQLDAPKADRAQIENIVTEYEVALGVAERSPEKAIHQSPFGEAVKAAEAYGFQQCIF